MPHRARQAQGMAKARTTWLHAFRGPRLDPASRWNYPSEFIYLVGRFQPHLGRTERKTSLMELKQLWLMGRCGLPPASRRKIGHAKKAHPPWNQTWPIRNR